jgi:hypothetical protein
MTITKLFPAIPFLSSAFETCGTSGTGFRKALSTSMISPSTERSCTISPEAFTLSSCGVKGSFDEQPAAKPANNPAAINSLRDDVCLFIEVVVEPYKDDLRFTHVCISASLIFVFFRDNLDSSTSTSFPSCVSIVTVVLFRRVGRNRYLTVANADKMPSVHRTNFFLDTGLFSFSITIINTVVI